MPCFTISILAAISDRDYINEIFIRKYIDFWGGLSAIDKIEGHTVYKVSICDEAAASFIHDLPAPFFVSHINHTFTGVPFYKHAKIPRPHIPPPHCDAILMNVYWNANKCELRSNIKCQKCPRNCLILFKEKSVEKEGPPLMDTNRVVGVV
jgi:hypothetical protein